MEDQIIHLYGNSIAKAHQDRKPSARQHYFHKSDERKEKDNMTLQIGIVAHGRLFPNYSITFTQSDCIINIDLHHMEKTSNLVKAMKKQTHQAKITKALA